MQQDKPFDAAAFIAGQQPAKDKDDAPPLPPEDKFQAMRAWVAAPREVLTWWEQAENEASWYEATLNAGIHFGLPVVKPLNAAILLHGQDPDSTSPEDAAVITSDDTMPSDFKNLRRVFEAAAEGNPRGRTLLDWMRLADRSGCKYHRWAGRYVTHRFGILGPQSPAPEPEESPAPAAPPPVPLVVNVNLVSVTPPPPPAPAHEQAPASPEPAPAPPAESAPTPVPESEQQTAPTKIDFKLLATREQLIDAFGRFVGMDAKWFDKVGDTPALERARKVTGQGGRGHITEPWFCPFEVMLWLIDPKRRKGGKLGEAKGWELLEKNFPNVYNTHSTADPRHD